MKLQSRREIRKIVEMHDGCVYKTAFVGYVWVDITKDEPAENYTRREKIIAEKYGGDFLISLPSSATYEQSSRFTKDTTSEEFSLTL